MESSPAPPPSAAPPSGAVNASPAPSPKIRLMCSYGGHIVPRPMDKTLCYAGGETRIVAVDRRTAYSLSSLTSHLSKSLLNGRPFSLKYQLPNHDLDSLISISTDEDLANMIEEYDRLSASPSRLRFFLFPSRSAGDGDLNEDWFIDALKNAGVVTKERSSDSESEGKVAAGAGSGGPLVDSGTSLPESIVLEKNSSFGSTSSSASMSHSPAIRSGGGGGGGGEEGVGIRLQDFKAAMPLVDSVSSDSSLASQIFSPQGIVYHDASGFNESKVVSSNRLETESSVSDWSPRGDLLTPVPVQASGYVLSNPMDQQQPQVLPAQSSAMQQPPPQQCSHSASQPHYVTQYYQSPVPVASYPAVYQHYVQTHQPVQYHQINSPYGCPVYMVPVGQAHNPCDMSLQNTLGTAQNVAQGHSQVPSNPVMVASTIYFDGYQSAAPAPEYVTTVYRTPAVATQTVGVPSDEHPSQPQVPPNPVMVASPMVYDGHKPAASAPEYAAKVYRTSALVTPPANFPSDDRHQQLAAFPPSDQSSQPLSSAPLENASYVNEYEDHMHAQIYKTQPPGPTLPSQLQAATNAATKMISETLAQLHVDNTKH